MSTLCSRVAGCLVALSSLVAITVWTPEVEACSPPLPGWWRQLHTPEVPADGFVIVSFYCHASCDPELELPAVTVRDAVSGTEIPGEVTLLANLSEPYRMFGWRATCALVPGQYQLDLHDASIFGGDGLETFAAVAPVSVGLETLTVSENIQGLDLQEGEEVCCPSGPVDSCGGHYCYQPSFQRTVSIGVEWTSATARPHWSQYLHRITWDGNVTPDQWRHTPHTVSSFETARAEYCYTLELKSLIDGSIERLPRTCLAHPAGLELGSYERDPAEIKRDLGRCEEPPTGLETAWCQARAEYCAEYPEQQCAGLSDSCEAPGTGGAGGAPPIAPTPSDSDDGGCSIAAGAREPSAWGWAAALIGLALGWRRKPRN